MNINTSLTFVVPALVLLGCKNPTESQAGSCNGAAVQSVLVPDSALQREWTNSNSLKSGRESGVGGFLVFLPSGRDVAQALQKEADSSDPVPQGIRHCTVNLFDAGWSKSAAGQQDDLKLLAWTSRNCVDYSQSNETAYLLLQDLKQPLPAKIHRQGLDPIVRSKISSAAESAVTDMGNVYRPLVYADIHNFDRFIISVARDHFAKADSAHSIVKSRVDQVFSARRAFVEELPRMDSNRYTTLKRWIETTEQQALLRNVQAVRGADLVCLAAGASVQNPSCSKVRAILLEEHAAVMQMLASTDSSPARSFDAIWDAPFSWNAPATSLERIAKERELAFAKVFGYLQRMAAVGTAPSVGGLAPATLASSAVEGFSGSIYEAAFLHGYHRSSPDAAPNNYQAWPFAHMFRVKVPGPAGQAGPPAVNVVPAAGGDIQRTRGLSFADSLMFTPSDEGQMVSLFGLAPAAFVSVPGVRFGSSPGQRGLAGSKKKNNPTSGYSRTNCSN
jgi:hypothetical protein